MKVILSSIITGALIFATSSSFAETFAQTQMKERIQEMDDNSDKKINFKEYYEESFTDNSDSYDVNKDGYITADEVEQELTEDLIETVDEMNRLGVTEKGVNSTIIRTLKLIEKDAEKIVDLMDTDNDNLVEEDEIRAYKRKQFAKLDKNKDGFLSGSDVNLIKKNKGYPIRWPRD